MKNLYACSISTIDQRNPVAYNCPMQARVLHFLHTKNARITRAREAIIDIIFSKRKPLSAAEVISNLKRKNVFVNKTTVYRELDFLLKNGLLKPVFLKPGTVHYESAFLPHHHHLVCDTCGSIAEIDCVVDEQKLLQKIKTNGFEVKQHKFELYGTCTNCT